MKKQRKKVRDQIDISISPKKIRIAQEEASARPVSGLVSLSSWPSDNLNGNFSVGSLIAGSICKSNSRKSTIFTKA